jgi:fructose-bisphosphate aldolase class 1
MDDLKAIASALCAPGKGILASDESPGTMGKRLVKHGIENTEVGMSRSCAAAVPALPRSRTSAGRVDPLIFLA